MGFNAAKDVEPLDYDFTTMVPLPKGLENAKGTIPEPSTDRLDTFSRRYSRLVELLNKAETATVAKEAADLDKPPPSPDESDKPVMTAMDALTIWLEEAKDGEELPPTLEKAETAYVDLLVYITQGTPSRDEITAMPARTRAAFLSWLVEELLIPKGLRNDMKRYLEAVPSE